MNQTLAAAAMLIALGAVAPASADEQLVCLNGQEQRAAIANGKTIPLAAAVRSVRGSVRARGSREVVKARLCKEGNRLVYLLTVLTRDGKVSRATVDAGSGRVVDAR